MTWSQLRLLRPCAWVACSVPSSAPAQPYACLQLLPRSQSPSCFPAPSRVSQHYCLCPRALPLGVRLAQDGSAVLFLPAALFQADLLWDPLVPRWQSGLLVDLSAPYFK